MSTASSSELAQRRTTETNTLATEMPYVLITPARNEENYIEKLIQSVTAQTIPPVKWVIVNDGSTDATEKIVTGYLSLYPWMELVNLDPHRDRSFAAKVNAFNAGFDRVKNLKYEVVGNLDSDVSFDPEYIAFLLDKFRQDSKMGVCGTIFREESYSSGTDSFEGLNHVAGGCQLFRRQCFQDIGGYIPNKAGGIDWIAVTTARMLGWKTQSFREKSYFHYRSLGTAERSMTASAFSYGEKDYYLGNDPTWEFFRVLYRVKKYPYIVGGAALGLGYCWAFMTRTPRAVSPELMKFHRAEEMQKLKNIFRTMLRLQRVDSFSVMQGPAADERKS